MEEWRDETLSRNGPSQRLGPAKRDHTSKIDGNCGKSEANSRPGEHPGAAKLQDYSVDFEN